MPILFSHGKFIVFYCYFWYILIDCYSFLLLMQDIDLCQIHFRHFMNFGGCTFLFLHINVIYFYDRIYTTFMVSIQGILPSNVILCPLIDLYTYVAWFFFSFFSLCIVRINVLNKMVTRTSWGMLLWHPCVAKLWPIMIMVFCFPLL